MDHTFGGRDRVESGGGRERQGVADQPCRRARVSILTPRRRARPLRQNWQSCACFGAEVRAPCVMYTRRSIRDLKPAKLARSRSFRTCWPRGWLPGRRTLDSTFARRLCQSARSWCLTEPPSGLAHLGDTPHGAERTVNLGQGLVVCAGAGRNIFELVIRSFADA